MPESGPEFPIYHDLRAKILSGEISDNERLVETTLARQYEASRLHIKSALRLLEQEQLAVHIPRCGFVAKSVSQEGLMEIIELRLALEGAIFGHLVDIVDDDDIEQLRWRLQRISVFLENEMYDDMMNEVDAFYAYAYERSGYSRIVAILNRYDDYLKYIRRSSANDKRGHRSSFGILCDIFDALEARDKRRLLHHVNRRRPDGE